MDFETLYSHVTGELINTDQTLNIYANGKKGAKLLTSAFELKQSLYARLGAEEDNELVAFEDTIYDIAKLAAEQVYNYCQRQEQ